MANTNFIVQNGLTVGPLTISAGNGDVSSSGNLTIAGNLSVTGQILANSSVVALSVKTLTVSQTAGVTIGGLQAATISDAQAFAIALG